MSCWILKPQKSDKLDAGWLNFKIMQKNNTRFCTENLLCVLTSQNSDLNRKGFVQEMVMIEGVLY